jgi:hypothetical protein
MELRLVNIQTNHYRPSFKGLFSVGCTDPANLAKACEIIGEIGAITGNKNSIIGVCPEKRSKGKYISIITKWNKEASQLFMAKVKEFKLDVICRAK